MTGFTVWERGDVTGIEVPAKRDPLVVGSSVLMALVAVTVIGLMILIALRTGTSGTHLIRVVIASLTLLLGAVACLAWSGRRELLTLQGKHVERSTRVLGLTLNRLTLPLSGGEARLHLCKEGERTQGGIVVVVGERSLYFAPELDETTAQRIISRLQPVLTTAVESDAAMAR